MNNIIITKLGILAAIGVTIFYNKYRNIYTIIYNIRSNVY